MDHQRFHTRPHYSVLLCYILSNTLVLYFMLRNTTQIYEKLGQVVNQSERYGRSIIKGFVTFVAMILAPLYICSITVIHATISPYTPTCSHGQYYECIPAHDIHVHREQQMSFISKTVVVSIIIPTYFIAAIYTIKTTTVRRVLSQRRYCRYLEVYLLWGLLVCIHVGVGLASLPLIIFLILIPTYTLFYLSCWVIGLTLLSLPVAALYRMCQVKWHSVDRYTPFRICDFLLLYTLATGIIVALLFLYFWFLVGGAHMYTVKGVIVSLIPPTLLSVAAFVIKRKVFPNQKLIHVAKADLNERQPLITSSCILKMEQPNGHNTT